jgi:hypothetical protein
MHPGDAVAGEKLTIRTIYSQPCRGNGTYQGEMSIFIARQLASTDAWK